MLFWVSVLEFTLDHALFNIGVQITDMLKSGIGHIYLMSEVKTSGTSYKVDMVDLNQTPIHEWCMVGRESKMGTKKTRVGKRLVYMFKIS